MFNPFSSLPATLLCVTLPLTTALPLLPSNHMVIAKMSIYKRMRRACCSDCGRSERDCSCMSGRVRGNVDTLGRAFPLSPVSVNDCATSFRACKFNPDTRSSVSVCGITPVLCRAPCFCESVGLMFSSQCDFVCGAVLPSLLVSLCTRLRRVGAGGLPPCSVNLCFLLERADCDLIYLIYIYVVIVFLSLLNE